MGLGDGSTCGSVMRRRAGRFRGDEGASAVEFALILPILAILLFGVIDYGWWFGETLGLRSGVREAASSALSSIDQISMNSNWPR